MKLLLAPLLAFGLATCRPVPPPPPPANVASAPALQTATDSRLSQISAHAEAADTAAERIAEPPVRAAVKGPISVVRSLAGPATAADRAAALALVVKAQAGKLDAAAAGWAAARSDAAELAARVETLEAAVIAERAAAAAELQRQLAAARDEARQKAEARERLLLTALFFGLGALLILAAIGSIFLKAYVPMLGPQVSLWLAAAGAALILTGIVVRAVNRLIEDHPYIFWGGLLAATLAVVAAAALMFANHHHAKASPA